MKKPTRPLQANSETQTPSDEPNLGAAFLVIGGFILVATAIFVLLISGHL